MERDRRLETAGRVMVFLLDKKNADKNYEIYSSQLEQMKLEYGIHFDIEKGRVFYPNNQAEICVIPRELDVQITVKKKP